MTNEQAKWLADHRVQGYRALSNTPSGWRWVRRGMLHIDGSFDLAEPHKRLPLRKGSFEVGVLEEIPKGNSS